MAKSEPVIISPQTRNFSILPNLTIPLIVFTVTVAGEYFFRHYVLFWLPVIGNLNVNDMISLLLAYTILALICGMALHLNWINELKKVGYALNQLIKRWDKTIWALLVMLSLVILPYADQFLWQGIKLPMVVSSYQNPIKWLVSFAPVLKIISLISVNGLFIPIAEEFLWRGIIQVRLLRIFSKPMAIGITALLFSLKHVIVDASFGRFLTLLAFGIICGIVAQKKDWYASAAIHLFVNTATTIMGLIMGLS
ncbi:hypothetical protein BH09BAC6_BH09BAC6_33140 [soil metagenome]|jgi:membrane protease YdiL (CAAX protease family)